MDEKTQKFLSTLTPREIINLYLQSVSDVEEAWMEVMHSQTECLMFGVILEYEGKDAAINVNGTRLDWAFINQKENDEVCEIIQNCFLQLLAPGKDVEQRHFADYRRVVKYMRNVFELTRMELHLSGQPTYTPELKHVNLFIKLLEERIKVWDAAARAAVKPEPKAKAKRKTKEPKKKELPLPPSSETWMKNYILWQIPKKED